jgi:hypothetical protein
MERNGTYWKDVEMMRTGGSLTGTDARSSSVTPLKMGHQGSIKLLFLNTSSSCLILSLAARLRPPPAFQLDLNYVPIGVRRGVSKGVEDDHRTPTLWAGQP